MTTARLKSILSKKISKIDDLDFLNALKVLIETKENSGSFYKLNDVQRRRIKKSREQFRRGDIIENDKVFDELDKWLKEK